LPTKITTEKEKRKINKKELRIKGQIKKGNFLARRITLAKKGKKFGF
jgi:hypothetical protein